MENASTQQLSCSLLEGSLAAFEFEEQDVYTFQDGSHCTAKLWKQVVPLSRPPACIASLCSLSLPLPLSLAPPSIWLHFHVYILPMTPKRRTSCSLQLPCLWAIHTCSEPARFTDGTSLDSTKHGPGTFKKKVLSTLTMYTLFLLVYIKNSWHISHIRFCKCLLFFKDTEVCWICYMLIVQHLYKRLEFLRLWYWGLEPGPQEVKRKDPGMGSIRTKEGYKQFFHTWRSAPSVSLSSDTRREKL